jgi:hypothetical protein
MLVRIWALAAVWPRRSKGSSPAPFSGCCAADDCSEQREQCALALTSQTSQWAILAIFSARLREYLQTWKSFQSSSPNTPRLISFSISPTQGETPKQELGAGRDSRPCPPSPVQFSRTALHSLDPVRASPDAVLLARRLDAQLISARGHPHHQPSCQSLALPVVFCFSSAHSFRLARYLSSPGSPLYILIFILCSVLLRIDRHLWPATLATESPVPRS